MKRITVEIVRSTDKAHFIKSADGRQGWIQARWLREDSTVNSDTFGKSAGKAQMFANMAKNAADFKEALISFTPDVQTERAVGVVVNIDYIDVEKDVKRTVWFPKSQIVNGAVKGWLINAKLRELRELVSGRGSVAFECVAIRQFSVFA